MGSLMTPTTAELFYAFVNLDDSPLPGGPIPEEDVFSRAFKQATIPQPDFSKKDTHCFAQDDSPTESPQELIFDDFLAKDTLESGDTSPSSVGSSSSKPTSNFALNPSAASTIPGSRQNNVQLEMLAGRQEAPANTVPESRPDPTTTQTIQGRQTCNPPTAQNPPQLLLANEASNPPKQPRRRNTKRKIRTEDEEAAKRKMFLERNRMAAQKCRSRKKRQTNTLEEDLALQQEINRNLKEQLAELLDEVGRLKEVYIQCEQECQHAKIEKKVSEEDPKTELKMEVDAAVPETMDVS